MGDTTDGTRYLQFSIYQLSANTYKIERLAIAPGIFNFLVRIRIKISYV